MNVFISGGSKGLGKAIVECFACKPGNIVYFTYNKSIEAAVELKKKYPHINPIHCDFTNNSDLLELNDKLNKIPIDVLINNYSTNFSRNHFHKTDLNAFERIFVQNVLPVISISQILIKQFIKKRKGKIITILSSSVSEFPPVGMSAYTASKNYMLSLHKSWSVEYLRYNITSNCISPSMMQTDMNEKVDDRIIESFLANHPLKRMVSTEEVAETVFFLAHSSSHINGQNIVLH